LPPQDFARYAPDDTLAPCGMLHQRTALKNRSFCLTHSRLAATTPASCWGEFHELLITRSLSAARCADAAAGVRWTCHGRHGRLPRAVNGQSVLAPFLDADGDLPGWFALELMAQTVGVWSGWHRQQQNQDISRWVWCSARELVCASGRFAAGDAGHHRQLLMQDERFGSFECAISADEDTLATGRINTFQPSAEELTSLFNQGEKRMSRSVLVTGASKGIGRAIACQLAADGFTVGVHYHRDAAGAQETLDAITQAGGNGRLLSF
jgi:predicted hotdog family 3-hydroxylacyl-ACP dehydratase